MNCAFSRAPDRYSANRAGQPGLNDVSAAGCHGNGVVFMVAENGIKERGGTLTDDGRVCTLMTPLLAFQLVY